MEAHADVAGTTDWATHDAAVAASPDPHSDKAAQLALQNYGSQPLTDAGNAEVFVGMYGDFVRYDHGLGRWLVWNGHYWRPDDDAAVHRMALEVVRARHNAATDAADLLGYEERRALSKWALGSESRNRLDAMLAIAKTMKPVADNGKGWDAAKGLIACENGVIDLHTGEFRDGRPEDKLTKSTGLDYERDAVCPRWEKFVFEVLEDAEVVAFMKRLLGYGITGEAVLDLLVFLMGVGRNGKSTLIEAAHRALGDYATSISPHAFLDARKNSHTTEKRDLAGARFAYTEELGDSELDMNTLKAYSGGSPVRARGIRENTIEFPQTWLLFFTTNGLPKLNDNSWGAWSRIIAIDFPRIFTGKEEPGLEDTLRVESAGILRWLVEGAVEWYREGLGEWPAAVVEKTAEYREELDPLAPLLAEGYLERCEETTWTPVANLAIGYTQYANAKGWPAEKRWSEKFLGTHLGAQFPKKRRTVKVADGSEKKMVGYLGVRLGPMTQVTGPSSWDISGTLAGVAS